MKILAYPLTALYALAFLLSICIFHPILWISHRVFGYNALQHSVNALQFVLLRCLNILGTRFTYTNNFENDIPKDTPLIIVSNHQSMYDISPILWYMRQYHPKFISKIELGKGIPSVSYNLRHGGAALIDRKNPRQSIRAINEFSEFINEKNMLQLFFQKAHAAKTAILSRFNAVGCKL
ncbi:lysophospholipid acyltransferase family protein [Formosa agariphila]|nr:lysophospholipid acyltransferase family protein [Formosa agariphila]